MSDDKKRFSREKSLVFDYSVYETELEKNEASQNKKKQKYRPLRVENYAPPKRQRKKTARSLDDENFKSKTVKITYACPPLKNRLTAVLIDLFLIYGLIFLSNKLFPLVVNSALFQEYYEFLTLRINSQFMTELRALQIGISCLIYGSIVVMLKNSLGKSLMDIYIANHHSKGAQALLFQVILRELAWRPISLISVFGGLMCLFDNNKRGFHDRINGTVLLEKID